GWGGPGDRVGGNLQRAAPAQLRAWRRLRPGDQRRDPLLPPPGVHARGGEAVDGARCRIDQRELAGWSGAHPGPPGHPGLGGAAQGRAGSPDLLRCGRPARAARARGGPQGAAGTWPQGGLGAECRIMSDPIVRRRVTLPKNRQSVTREPDPGGRWTPLFPGMIGYNSQGGGKVPPLWWTSSPKARQEEMTDETLATRWLSPDYPLARALAES